MEGEDPRYVRVVCSKCRAVLHPRVEKAGRQVRCPDCYSPVLVPHPPEPEATPKRRDVGEYSVRDEFAPERSKTADADLFLVLCPKCQARLHPRRQNAGRRARCPDCETVFVIPAPPKPEKVKTLPSPGKYVMGQEPKRAETEFHYLTVEREPEPEPLAPPTRGWFIRGVFTFPWWPGAWARWTILSLLMVPALFMTGIVLWLAGGSVNQGTTAVPYLMLPLMWLWVWALSYAAGSFVAIIEDTGSSNDEVTSWPEGDWRERVLTMLYVGLHLGLALAAGAAVGWLVGLVSEPLWGAVASGMAANLFFPLFLLSSMEAGAMLTPYSPVMFRSLVKTPGGWAIVYAESLISLTLACGLLAVGGYWLPALTVFLAAPVLATVVFIEARLYGRLAWHVGQLETKSNTRKRKKKRD
ncbi:MAG TPA: hypothetical protein VFI31_22540 [Pirellulales bacterium]|nr:hypothetical protein [Pirellulales bacterium]